MNRIKHGKPGGLWTALLAPAWHSGSDARPSLSRVIDRLRQRWRLRLLLHGLFLTLALMTALFVISAVLLNYWHFAGPVVWLLRFVMLVTLVGLLLQFCARPLRRRVDDANVALYLQEHEPALKSVVLGAVDAQNAPLPNTSPRLVTRLVEQALDACAGAGYGHAVEQRKLIRAAAKLGLVLLVIGALIVAAPEFLGFSTAALLMPWTNANQYSPYRIELAPGNIEIARGSDQLVSAQIAGFDGNDVLLFTSDDTGFSWQQTPMMAGSKPGLYEAFVFDLDQPLNYYVTGAGRQSATYRIDVVDIPAIEDISLRYHFPAYTMLEPETTHGSGDIAALRGTRVEVRIKPTIEIPGGTLLLDDGQRIDLVEDDGENWLGEISVEQDGAYRVTLQRDSGAVVDASADFRITALDDGHPWVTILNPGRDTKVSMIEEPVMKVRATDDQGIAKLELVLRVNGAEEQRVKLALTEVNPSALREFDAEHILYLEDLDLRPGDLISYYVQAEDRAPAAQAKSATSDLFFYQVRPFSLDYRSADQPGGGGGGAQSGQQQGHLSDQQKQFVVATFKMIRDRDNFDVETYQNNLELLARAQARIRDRVEAIVRRLGSRSIVRRDEQYRVITTELPLAAEAMIEVEKQLKDVEIGRALADAQVALVHLQRADAAFREINVSLANRGGGGAGSNADLEDLADLFRLEMDKLRNQYETVQHGQQQQTAQVIDETLERLRELAQRQQRELDHQLRRQGQAVTDGANANQLALAAELEEMARQLERLSRTQPNPQLQQSIRQMRQAAEAMRRAASNSTGGGANEARQAAENLREAQRLLDRGRVRQFSDAVERSLRRAELAEKRQAAIKQRVARLDDKWGESLKAQLKQLDHKKQALSEELAKLENELSQLASTAREEQPRASQSLKQAIRAARENRLHDRIGRTRDMVQLGEKEQALDNESKIQQGIAQVREHIETALANVSEQGKRGMQRALERIRSLTRELQAMRERATNAGANRGSGTLNPGGSAWGGNLDIRRQLEGIAANTDQLGRRLRELGVEAGDIDTALDRIQELIQAQNDPDTALSTELTDQALSALMELEYRLRQQLDDPDYIRLLASESTELPDNYKDMVADYFRMLSQP